MTLQQLEYICAIAEEGSISGASRRLHIAQPPISRQLAQLENELGVQLFIRSAQGITLTHAGQKFYQESRRLMQGVENMVSDMKSIDKGIMGVLEIGTEYSVASYSLPLIAGFHDRYPHVELKVHVDTTQELEKQLRRGSLHVVFSRVDAVGQADLQKLSISEDPLELLMTETLDPAPGLREIPIERLKDVPLCRLGSDDDWNFTNILSDACQQHGFLPRIVCQCYSTHIAIQMVLAGLGIIYLPRSLTDTVPGSGLYSKPVAELHPVSSSMLIWDDNVYMPPCARLFIELVQSGSSPQM